MSLVSRATALRGTADIFQVRRGRHCRRMATCHHPGPIAGQVPIALVGIRRRLDMRLGLALVAAGLFWKPGFPSGGMLAIQADTPPRPRAGAQLRFVCAFVG